MARLLLALVLVALGMVALAAQEKPERLALPWKPEDLRKTFAVGMSARWRQEISDKNGKHVRFMDARTTEASEKAFTVQKVWTDETGKETNRRDEVTKWEEYPPNFTFTAKDTKASDETLTVAAGKFETRVYRQTLADEGETYVSTFWFIKDRPGIFAKFETSGGGTSLVMTLEEFHDAADSFASLPWTLDEIKRNWKAGFATTYKIHNDAQPAMTFKSVASEITDEEFTIVETTSVEGKPAQTSQPRKQKWNDFYAALQMEKAKTEVSDETVETAAGKIDCSLYVMRKKGDFKGVQKVWLAKKEPGLIVKLHAEGEQNNAPLREVWLLEEYKKG